MFMETFLLIRESPAESPQAHPCPHRGAGEIYLADKVGGIGGHQVQFFPSEFGTNFS